MSRVITSPSQRWPGTVTLADPLTFVQYIAWRDTLRAAPDPAADYDRYCLALLPGLCACVEQWNLEGVGQLSPDTFPASPRRAADELLSWLVSALRVIITGIDAPDPNLPPPSTPGA